MTIIQTVEIPADRRITFEIPPQIPAGTKARFELIWFPVNSETKLNRVEPPSAEANDSSPRDKDGKILLTKELIEEMVKNSPTLQKLTGILHTDMTLDEIREERLAKYLK